MSYYTFKQRRIVDEDGVDYEVMHFSCDDDAIVDLPWLRGIRFEHAPPQPIRLRFEDDAPEDGVFIDYLGQPMPLVSQALRDVLLRAGAANLEFFDTIVEGAAEYEDIPHYYAMNVVGRIEVADPAQSTGVRAFGVMGADLYDTFVPREGLPQGLAIFRMAEQASTLLVSSQVVHLCEQLGVQTLEFLPLAPYGPGSPTKT